MQSCLNIGERILVTSQIGNPAAVRNGLRVLDCETLVRHFSET